MTELDSFDMDVPVAGHRLALHCTPTGTNCCGRINDGVVFWFEGEGRWVVSLKTLKEIVNRAEGIRAQYLRDNPWQRST